MKTNFIGENWIEFGNTSVGMPEKIRGTVSRLHIFRVYAGMKTTASS